MSVLEVNFDKHFQLYFLLSDEMKGFILTAMVQFLISKTEMQITMYRYDVLKSCVENLFCQIDTRQIDYIALLQMKV